MWTRPSAILLTATLILVPLAVAAAPLPHFTQPNAIWNQDVSGAALRPNSADMMTHLEDLATAIRGSDCFAPGTGSGCWGDTRIFNFQLDISFYVLHATQATTTRPVVENTGYYSPDCEAAGFVFPVPVGGGIESTSPPAYTCNTKSNDCHLLVVNDDTHILYEAYNVSKADATGVHALCGLSWDLDKVYPRYGRGEHCTSADAAGFPMAPLMLNADEVWASAQSNGDIGHAIRFILGNNRMAASLYVHPASHGIKDVTTDTDPNAVPYGSQLRLKSTFDVNGFSSNSSVRAILRSLQKYGMFLSDGGGVPLSAESDFYTTHKWDDADVNVDSHSLFGIRPTDFEVIEAGDPMTVTYDCVRTPDDFLFIDQFQY